MREYYSCIASSNWSNGVRQPLEWPDKVKWEAREGLHLCEAESQVERRPGAAPGAYQAMRAVATSIPRSAVDKIFFQTILSIFNKPKK